MKMRNRFYGGVGARPLDFENGEARVGMETCVTDVVWACFQRQEELCLRETRKGILLRWMRRAEKSAFGIFSVGRVCIHRR